MLVNKRTLENKLYKLGFAPTILVCLIVSLFFLLSFLDHKKTKNTLQVDVIASLFDGNSLEDKKLLDRLSDSVLRNSTYFGISILDTDFNPLYERGVVPNKDALNLTLEEQTSIQVGDKIYLIKDISLINPNRQETSVQNAKLLISKSTHIQSLWYYQAGSFFLLLVIYAFISIAYFSHRLKREITQELDHATQGIRKLIDDDFKFRLNVEDQRLFSPLAEHVNTLADEICDSQEYLRNVVETSTKELRESLETVEIQNIEIDLARKNALKANELTCEFLANTSHEVRTPINGIIGFSNLLRKTAISDQQAEYIDTIEESAKVLLFNMNDMIDYSRLETGKLNLDYKPIDVREIIIESHNYVLAHKGHDNITIDTKISKHIPKKLLGDSMRMQQVYNNLLSCAADLTQALHLTSHIELIDQDGGKFTLKISVLVEGANASNELVLEASKILTSNTLDNKVLASKNMMSLVIAKGLIARMHGQIGISIHKDQTNFWLTLELGSTGAAKVHARKENVPQERVLIVDDNPANRRLVKELLKDMQLIVETAESGEQAIELCKKNRYTLILMDIQMPGLDGYETSVAIRGQEKPSCRTPIVALTAHAVEDEKNKILLSGMDDFISKPIGETELCELLSRWTKNTCIPKLAIDEDDDKEESVQIKHPSQPVSIITSLDLAKGKADLAKDMLTMLLSSIQHELSDMRTLFENSNFESLQDKVHKIHGGACYCGVPRLLESSAALDKALMDSDTNKVDALIPVFFESCEELLKWQSEHDLDEIFAS